MRLNQGPAVKSETGPPTAEHRKTGREGQLILAGALVFVVICAAAALAGFGAVALTAAGLCVALFVVGLMLHYESERQRQRPDSSLPRSGP